VGAAPVDLTVVVPTRNSARTLEACLQSIRAQDTACHLVVVDNHSDDSTVAIALRLADTVIVAGPERSAQRNAGARVTTTDYVAFIDSDMVLEPGVLSQARALLAAGAGLVTVPETSFGAGFWSRVVTFERDFYAGTNTLGVEAARFFRRQVFEAAGGFDELMLGAEDWDIMLRAAPLAPAGRTDAAIRHDEGAAGFFELCARKAPYASGMPRFVARHRRRGLLAAIDRPYLRRPWKLLVPHPVLGAGLVTLKTGQSAAIAASAMPAGKLLEYLRLALKMPATIGNWPTVLARVLLDRAGISRGGTLLWVTREGTRFRVDNNGVARGGLFEVFVWDVYGLDGILADAGDGPLAVLDLGAHVGEFVVALAGRGRLGRAACYEPSPDSLRLLRRNMTANNLADRVEVHPEAMARTEGEVVLYSAARGSCEATIFPLDGAEATTVRTTTLSAALLRFDGPIDFLKVDIEGAEVEVLDGLDPALLDPVRRVLIEYHPHPAGSRELVEKSMSLAGFRLRWHRPLGRHGILYYDRADAAGGQEATRADGEIFGPAPAAPIDARKALGLVIGSRRVFANWLPVTARILADRAGVDSGRPLRFVTRGGTRILVPNNGVARAGTYEVFVRDVYRLAEVLPLLPPGDLTVLDLGAQVGDFAMALAERGRLARAVCYEPSPLSFQLMERNIAANGLTGRVQARRQGVGGRAGIFVFDENAPGSGSATMLGLPDASGSFEAEVVTLARAIEDFDGPISLLKVNIEGAEYDAMAAASAEDLRPVGAMLLEHHNVQGRNWEQLVSQVRALGFDLGNHHRLWHGGGILFLQRR
jgi:FkbM family methyltransferase